MIVVDNSVILPLFIDDEDSQRMEKLVLEAASGSQLLVPRLWINEFGNGLLVALRRGRLGSEQVAFAHRRVHQLPLQIVEFPEIPDLGPVHLLAQEHGLSFYDAGYLALALARNAHLATSDKQLAKAAKRKGILHVVA